MEFYSSFYKVPQGRRFANGAETDPERRRLLPAEDESDNNPEEEVGNTEQVTPASNSRTVSHDANPWERE